MLTVGSVTDHEFVCLDKQLLPVKTRQKSSALTDWSWPLSVTLSEKKMARCHWIGSYILKSSPHILKYSDFQTHIN